MVIRRTPVNSPFARFVDRMIENAARDYAPVAEYTEGDFALALDIVDNDAQYVVKANLPGVKPENIDIQLHDNVLTVSAEINEEKREEKGTMLLQERQYGKFVRSVRFPTPVNADAVEAGYNDGVLHLNVPKAQNAGAKRISIGSGKNGK
jgi:HSP20 family protein